MKVKAAKTKGPIMPVLSEAKELLGEGQYVYNLPRLADRAIAFALRSKIKEEFGLKITEHTKSAMGKNAYRSRPVYRAGSFTWCQTDDGKSIAYIDTSK